MTVFDSFADADECNTPDANNCSSKADCVNKPGSFECNCRPGYTGDGVNCNGKVLLSTRSSQDPCNFLCEAGGLKLLISWRKENKLAILVPCCLNITAIELYVCSALKP